MFGADGLAALGLNDSTARRGIQLGVSIGFQVAELLLIALPVACVSWTVTHEEIFRELRELCAERSHTSRGMLLRKFYYVFTCEYCFSHYVTVVFLAITHLRLLFPDWRGTLLAFFSLPYVANLYMALFAQTKLEAKKDRVSAHVIQEELEIKRMEREQKMRECERDETRITPAA